MDQSITSREALPPAPAADELHADAPFADVWARAIHVWAGAASRALFCRWWVPEGGTARAGVVLLAPLGFEGQAVGQAYRALATALVSHGIAVLQLDPYGTGDSADAAGGVLEGWQASVQAAVDLVRQAGAPRAFLVAMRLSATVAASVAAGCELDGLVLWDPCESGRAYLAEEQLLRSVYAQDNGAGPAVARDPGGGVEVLGATYAPADAAAISALRLQDAPGPMARDCLVLARPDRPLGAGASRRLEAEGAQWGRAADQQRLLSVWPLLGARPEATIAAVTGWLTARAGDDPRPISVPGEPRAVFPVPGGAGTEERVLALGAQRLFGVLSSPAQGPAPRTTVVLLNAGRVDHTGPGRLWVGLARSLAAEGLAVLRVDLSGLGDSPPRTGIRPDVVYSPKALEDIGEVLDALAGGSRDIVLAGLCSGAWHAVVAAGRWPLRSVVAVNPYFPVDRRFTVDDDGTVRLPAPPSPEQGAPGCALRAARDLARQLLPAGAKRAAHRAADAKWWWLARTGKRPRAVLDLRRAVEHGADMLVACRPFEAGLISRGERGTLARLQAKGRFQFEEFPGTDHTLLLEGSRRQVVPVVEAHLRRCAGPGTGTDHRPPPAPGPPARDGARGQDR